MAQATGSKEKGSARCLFRLRACSGSAWPATLLC